VKVLHVMPSLTRHYGGPVTALVGYVSAGAVRGVISTVVGPRCDDADQAWLQERMPDATIVGARAAGQGPWAGAPAALRAVARELPRADLVHVHGLLNPTSSLAARLAIAAGRPVVIGPFGTMSRYTFSHRRAFAKHLYFRLLDARNLRGASALHFTTAAEREEAVGHGIDANGRSYVVPPPYDVAADEARPPATSAVPVVLFLGRLDPKKGVDVLLDSWSHVIDECPTAQLRIAGSGPARYTDALRRRAGTMLRGIASVQFLGFVGGADKSRHLRDASVLVLPSQHENFGIAVLDAVAAGVPVIVAPGVQLAPWVVEQEVGRVVERSPTVLARTILDVLRDTALRQRVAAVGRDVVARAYGPSVVAPALEAMYRGALAHASRCA
jgi:glycosyltransferase involved in cell wall biosynthesis